QFRATCCNFQGYASDLESQSSDEPESECGVSACDPVISHDAQAAGQKFRSARRKRFPDIEDAKKYKSRDQIFPVRVSAPPKAITKVRHTVKIALGRAECE